MRTSTRSCMPLPTSAEHRPAPLVEFSTGQNEPSTSSPSPSWRWQWLCQGCRERMASLSVCLTRTFHSIFWYFQSLRSINWWSEISLLGTKMLTKHYISDQFAGSKVADFSWRPFRSRQLCPFWVSFFQIGKLTFFKIWNFSALNWKFRKSLPSWCLGKDRTKDKKWSNNINQYYKKKIVTTGDPIWRKDTKTGKRWLYHTSAIKCRRKGYLVKTSQDWSKATFSKVVKSKRESVCCLISKSFWGWKNNIFALISKFFLCGS